VSRLTSRNSTIVYESNDLCIYSSHYKDMRDDKDLRVTSRLQAESPIPGSELSK